MTRRVLGWLLPLLASLGVTSVLLLLGGAPPVEAIRLIGEGAFSGTTRLADTLVAWVPLAIAAAGLVVTFRAGLWNIGVEGQIIAGAIISSWVARAVPGGPWLVLPLVLVAGAVGGAVWGLAAGMLKVKGKVNEIFGGIGLGFVAQALATYLVIGPWKRTGVASTSGTEPFRPETWLPTMGDTRLSLVALAVMVVVLVGVGYLLAGTRFGLRLKAVGSNPTSARLLGVPADATMLRAFLAGGGLAGLAGGLLVTGLQHKLVPAIAGGRGFLAILVVLLARMNAVWVAPVALFFAAVSVGSSQLQLRLDLDSSLGAVIQGLLVLSALLIGGWQAHRRRAYGAPGPD
ncbi:MAG: ABC transporter permease [Actinomycetota bacterium]